MSFWRKELREGSDMARSRAAHALGQIGTPAKGAIPDLTARLRDDAPYVRVEAAQALGKFGPDARSAVPALAELYKKEDNRAVRDAVAHALKHIDPDEAARLEIR
jgi:HEAT repeat protein